jgi:uncharacterized membrane protein
VTDVFLVLSAFLASAVEMVEALTIVVAMGVTRGWRASLTGVVAATAALAVVVAALGPALTQVPLNALRLVVGVLLLIFGLQWLRKAIMRYTGLKELHDESLIYQREVSELEAAPVVATGMDWTAFTVAYKGVLLEGLEVVFIVITFGLTAGDMRPALLGAAAAAVVVTGIGAAVHAPLSRVPENTLKFVVGVMLSGFGTFWAGEGVGLDWPGADLAILGLIVFYALTAGAIIALVRSRAPGSGKVVTQT